jgi:hypothetical protein
MSTLEEWEAVAAIFYRDTGYMRPGKDDACRRHTREERQAKWDAWFPNYYRDQRKKRIMALMGFPDSASVKLALDQFENELEQERKHDLINFQQWSAATSLAHMLAATLTRIRNESHWTTVHELLDAAVKEYQTKAPRWKS